MIALEKHKKNKRKKGGVNIDETAAAMAEKRGVLTISSQVAHLGENRTPDCKSRLQLLDFPGESPPGERGGWEGGKNLVRPKNT